MSAPKPILLPDILQRKSSQAWQDFHAVIEQRFNEKLSIVEGNQEIIERAFALSDFVHKVANQYPSEFVELISVAKDAQLSELDYQQALHTLLQSCENEISLHSILRKFRHLSMANIAIADMLFDCPLKDSLSALSRLADALIEQSLTWIHADCQQKWGTPMCRNGKPQQLLVYAMGKLGGKELNFSSDIDLIFTYPETGETQGARKSIDNQQYFTRLGQKLIAALNQQTTDGFVYRVDMRLRPFGESGPLVMSFSALEDYYQEQGRDWERYAMLKARLVGDSEFHQQLQSMLKPFVFRRYIDFSVIDSLRKMKMMIAQEIRRKKLVNNIKLGAGGIREIEFIVQVFQLIRGGRIPQLQERNLLTVLPLLVDHNEIIDSTAQVLSNAYCFLRRVENIIQAFADQQTQTLPDDALNQQRLLTVLGVDTWQAFITELEQHMNAVHREFIMLIGEETPHQSGDDQQWQAIWLAEDFSEDVSDWVIQAAPQADAQAVTKILQSFKVELKKRSIGPRGRAMFDKLMPRLLFLLSSEPQMTLIFGRITQILHRVSTRTAYLELLYENEGALKHLIKLCLASEWISEHIAKYPILLDELIDPKLLHNPPALSQYLEDLQLQLLRIPEEDVESQMDSLRHFKQSQQLRIAAGDVSEVLPLMKVSDHLTALASAILHEVINQAWSQMSARYGVPSSLAGTDDKGFVAIGYGKMGGVELGYSSDLDLVFLHHAQASEMTDGAKEIPATQFYMKLAQRIMHIFNTRMSSGILYELDMRLRPSGNSGLLVIHMDNFAEYQAQEAWTWEHQALVRARGIYGPNHLIEKFDEIRKQVLTTQRDNSKLAIDVYEMREKMRQHLDKSNDDEVSLKHGLGGLVDIEFLAQYLVLKHAHEYPSITRFSDNTRIFDSLVKVELLTETQANLFIDTYQQLRNQGHIATLQNSASSTQSSDIKQLMAQTYQVCQQLLPQPN